MTLSEVTKNLTSITTHRKELEMWAMSHCVRLELEMWAMSHCVRLVID